MPAATFDADVEAARNQDEEEDPVSATLLQLAAEEKHEKSVGLDGAGAAERAKKKVELHGQAFETRMRQEAAREVLNKRRAAREAEAAAKEAAKKKAQEHKKRHGRWGSAASDPSPRSGGIEAGAMGLDQEEPEEKSRDALTDLVASLSLHRRGVASEGGPAAGGGR
jgi:hypothetical protein